MKEFVKKYGVLGFIAIVIVISLVFSKTPVEETIDAYNAPSIEDIDSEYIYVDVKGEIKNPGVYKVKTGTRLYYVIELAGGLNSDANDLLINLSVILKDQDVVIVPSVHDVVDELVVGEDTITNPSDTLLDINQANQMQLEELPGIGPSTALKIIEYRETIGYFDAIEDIMNVAGIGESTFDAIKDFIKV